MNRKIDDGVSPNTTEEPVRDLVGRRASGRAIFGWINEDASIVAICAATPWGSFETLIARIDTTAKRRAE